MVRSTPAPALGYGGWIGRALAVTSVALALGCGTTGRHMSQDYATRTAYQSGSRADGGYRYAEAGEFIEFCVELDNQDDRLRHPDDPTLRAAIDPAKWNPTPVYDSRAAVADAVARYARDPTRADDRPWAKLYAGIIRKANARYPQGWDASTLARDPDLNGFGPWQNAWLLYEGRGEYAGAYAIAIRGTVFSNTPSAVEDAWTQTVLAVGFLSPVVSFAATPTAAMHSGFAHATFTTLLDDRYGILRILDERRVPGRARLFMAGHSQGAAMATLVHAFLHYAMARDDAAPNPAFGLKGRDYRLKSYAFAQPKPGDYTFAADFAAITQGVDNALVINNVIDPVPKVPMTLQSIGDFDADFQRGLAARLVQWASSAGSLLRRTFGAIAEPFTRKSAEGYGYFFHYEAIAPLGRDRLASSWDFSPAGHVLYVYGTPGDGSDVFLQHHATTYRRLLKEQLGE